MHKVLLPTLLFTPLFASAQGLQTLIGGILGFINSTIIPFMLGVAFLFFVINAVRFFVLGNTKVTGDGDNKKTIAGDRGKARQLAVLGTTAFVLIIIFWGIVNLIASSIGLSGVSQPVTDYQDPTAVKRTGIQQSSPTNQPGNPADFVDCENDPNCSVTDLELPDRRGFFERIGDGISDFFNGLSISEPTQPRPGPLEPPFWAFWNRGGSNNDSSNEPIENSIVNCLLPNGTIQRLTLQSCLDQGGEVTQNMPATGTSFQLIDCTFFDATIGQQRTIQTSVENCNQFNGTDQSDSISPSATPISGGGSAGGSFGTLDGPPEPIDGNDDNWMNFTGQ